MTGDSGVMLSCATVAIALSERMLVQVVPGDPPIRVSSVEKIRKPAGDAWVIRGVRRSFATSRGRVEERTTYTVPVGYDRLKYVAEPAMVVATDGPTG